MKILLLSDTHYRGRSIEPQIIKLIQEHDYVLHAGDYANSGVLEEFESFGNFYGVAGNSDPWDFSKKLGRKKLIELGGIKIGICHGKSDGLAPLDKAKKMFGGSADVVIFGHSHIPHVSQEDGVIYVCPGSPSIPRGGSDRSCAQLVIGDSKISVKHISTA